MKIKHYVIVNFMSWQPVGWDREVGDPLLEQQRLATLEKYLLPSLERQTSRDLSPLKEHFGFEESWNMKKIN